MSYYHFVLVVVSILVSITTAGVIEPTHTPSYLRSSAAGQNSMPVSRKLTSENNDEREIVPLKSAISSLVKASQLKIWAAQDRSAHYAMTQLKLDQSINKVLASKKLETLSAYVDIFKKKHPESKTSLIDTLLLQYKNDFLLTLNLQEAKTAGNTKAEAMATKLQTELLEHWWSNNKNADDMFAFLRISGVDYIDFTKTKVTILDDYIKLLNAKNPEANIDMLGVLKKGFDGERMTALVLSYAMRNTEDLSATASKYRNSLFQEWQNSKLDPVMVQAKVFKTETPTPAVKAVIDDYRIYIHSKDLDLDVGWMLKEVEPRRL
ncbi:RxLR effector protein [Phytophthora megakarya]|uniref:RxLR effector protein n=1 Tax=Phytophthora megakarya TaxID=4795 RepID=A0A225W759_9STRA|nr:RxLR effector protein [Phytophthora megakarya]